MDKKLLSLLVCPICKGRLEPRKKELWCFFDKMAFPIRQEIPVMLVDEARALSSEEWEVR